MTSKTISVSAEIRQANDNFETIYAKGDAAGVAKLYTEGGLLLPTGREPIEGKPAIRDFWQAVMDLGIKQIKLKTMELDELEDTAIERGQYTLNGEDGQQLDRGKYIVIWRQDNGQWKLHRDIWNSSMATTQ